MNESESQITTQNPFALSTMDDAERMAKWIAESGCFGITKPAQALTLMLLAKEEGKTLSHLLKEVHVFDTGKLSQRADYTQSVFQKTGTILWHLRTNSVVAGSFFAFKPIDDAARERACKRFELQYELDIMQMQPEWDRKRESVLMLELSKLSRENECTIIRTLADAEAKGITQGKSGTKNNWAAGAISMLQWRCVTDAVKLIDPSVMSGLSSDVDLQDARTVEIAQREQFVAKALNSPSSSDADAIQAMIDQHLEEAAQPGTTQERKSQLQGLASELRCKLSDMGVAVEVKSEIVQEGPRTPEKRARAAVAPPKEEKPRHEAPSAKDDQIPGLEPLPQHWQDYTLATIKAPGFANKQLGELSKESIRTLWEKRGAGLANSGDHTARAESGFIRQAFEHHFPGELK